MAAKNPLRAAIVPFLPSRHIVLIFTFAWLATNPCTLKAQDTLIHRGAAGVDAKQLGATPNVNIGCAQDISLCGGGGPLIGRARWQFDIEPGTPLQSLLPPPPPLGQPVSPWLVKDLSQVPEVFFQKPLEVKRFSQKDLERMNFSTKEAMSDQRRDTREKAREQIAHTLVKINHINQTQPDLFVTMLMEYRSDLAGLPFLKGAACRMSKEVSRRFIEEVSPDGPDDAEGMAQVGKIADEVVLARVAAWMQTSPDNHAKRDRIVKTLAAIKHPATTAALAKLAVFAPEKHVRADAVTALKDRSRQDYSPTLIQGLRYPWPDVARHAADAVVALNRRDLVGQIAECMREPDPRAPFEQIRNGRRVVVVRELVRLNHHHNCITCHAPATSDPDFNANGSSANFITASVTLPEVFPSFGYLGGNSDSPELAVRVDVTYLRQDFSLMQKVENGLSGSDEERFDFLMRTRELNSNEIEAYHAWRMGQAPNYLTPNQQAALTVLRHFAGPDAQPRFAISPLSNRR